MSRAELSAQRRAVILNAAFACFTEKGFRATSLDDIRQAAAVSIGSIYHHFSNKEQLARTVFVEGLHDYHRALLSDLVQARDARAGVQGMVWFDLARLHAATAWSHGPLPVDEPWLGAAARELIGTLQAEFAADLAHWLGPHFRDGSLLALPIPYYLAILFGPARAFAAAWQEGSREPSLAQAQTVLASAAWAALRGPATRAAA